MTPEPSSALCQQAAGSLREHARTWWRQGLVAPIDAACEAVPDDALAQWPEVAFWRALAGLMQERAEVLACLERAYQGFQARDDARAQAVAAASALVACLLDSGAMDGVDHWLARWQALRNVEPPADHPESLLTRLGALAQGVLAGCTPEANGPIAAAIHAQLQPLCTDLSPGERLIAALVLVNHHFACQQFEQFGHLTAMVEHPAVFERAPAVMRTRWLLAVGFAHYQVGSHGQAEQDWQRGLALAQEQGLHDLQLRLSLALARLLIDHGQVDEAQRLVGTIQPRWGAGRVRQLIELQQTRARLMLLSQQPASAHATLQEALALADASGLSAAETGSCQTDRAQVLVALDQGGEALDLLAALAQASEGRDAEIFRCLHELLLAARLAPHEPAQAQQALARGLARARQARYPMFFRLLPALAAQLCAMALTAGLETAFVREVVRARALRAPADADAAWPWRLWVQMVGPLTLLHDGQPLPPGGKAQHKPLELLCLLGCQRVLALGVPAAIGSLWPEADAAAGRKNLEMTVQRLRRLLGDDTLLTVGEGRVACDTTRVSSDVQQRRVLVERLEAMAMQPPAVPGGAAACHELVARIVRLSRGSLLPEMRSAPWLDAARRQHARETVRAALAAATMLQHLGADDAERELLETALRIEPLAERLAQRLMHAHLRAGQQADALRVYQRLRQDLATQAMTPSAETESLRRSIPDPVRRG